MITHNPPWWHHRCGRWGRLRRRLSSRLCKRGTSTCPARGCSGLRSISCNSRTPGWSMIPYNRSRRHPRSAKTRPAGNCGTAKARSCSCAPPSTPCSSTHRCDSRRSPAGSSGIGWRACPPGSTCRPGSCTPPRWRSGGPRGSAGTRRFLRRFLHLPSLRRWRRTGGSGRCGSAIRHGTRSTRWPLRTNRSPPSTE